MSECKPGAVPVTRLALKREKCAVLKGRFNTPEAIANWARANYGCAPQETFLVVGLDPSMGPLGIQVVSTGGLDQTQADPRVVFSSLLLMGATGFILIHNHPSGSLEPSREDIELTRQMKSAGKLLSLRCVDHLIISSAGFTSLVARGLMP